MTSGFLIHCKTQGKYPARQFFSIKGLALSVKSGIQFYLQDKGIENLADIQLIPEDNGSGAPTDGGAIGGVQNGVLIGIRIDQEDING